MEYILVKNVRLSVSWEAYAGTYLYKFRLFDRSLYTICTAYLGFTGIIDTMATTGLTGIGASFGGALPTAYRVGRTKEWKYLGIMSFDLRFRRVIDNGHV